MVHRLAGGTSARPTKSVRHMDTSHHQRSARARGGSPLAPKDPAHVASARARWGPARVVRLDDLDSDERAAVLALVRLFGAKKDATEGQSPVASTSEVCDGRTSPTR